MKGYQAIFRDEFDFDFQDYFDIFKCKSIDYIAVGIQDTIKKSSASVMSNTEWQEVYSREHFFIQDPLRESVYRTNKNIILLDALESSNSFEKMVMENRKKHGVAKGLVFVDRELGYNVLITLGTKFSKFDSAKFVRNNIFEINEIKSHAADKASIVFEKYKSLGSRNCS